VDIYGRPKLSYEVLRLESSPIASLLVENHMNAFRLLIRTRHDTPMYTLRGYRFRGVFYGQGDIAVEQQEAELPEMPQAPKPRSNSCLANRSYHSMLDLTCFDLIASRPILWTGSHNWGKPAKRLVSPQMDALE
jgi:hypothetical protein